MYAIVPSFSHSKSSEYCTSNFPQPPAHNNSKEISVYVLEIKMESITIIEIHDMCKDKEELVKNLRLWNLIPNEGELRCTVKHCDGTMTLAEDDDRGDGYRWRCTGHVCSPKRKRVKCSQRMGLRKNPFFCRSKLSIEQVS